VSIMRYNTDMEIWGKQLEMKVLGECKFKMKTPARFFQLLEDWSGKDNWPALDLFSDGGADFAGTEWAQAEYGWVVSLGGEALDVVAEGTAPVWGPAGDMDSNRAELYGLVAVLRRVRLWEGEVVVWVDNWNVVQGIGKLLDTHHDQLAAMDDADDSWRTGLERIEYTGRRRWLKQAQDRDLYEVLAVMVGEMKGTIKVNWQRSHQDTRKPASALTKTERGNVLADAHCNVMKRAMGDMRFPKRIEIPRPRSWRVAWAGDEVVGRIKTELQSKTKVELVLEHFKTARGWGNRAKEWIGQDAAKSWVSFAGDVGKRVRVAKCMYSMWETIEVKMSRASKLTREEQLAGSVCELCGDDATTGCRNWHLIGQCTSQAPRIARLKLRDAVSKLLVKAKVGERLAKLILLPWQVDGEGKHLEMRSPGLMSRVTRGDKYKLRHLCRVVTGGFGGADDVTDSDKCSMEARQMVCKGMVGSEWDEMLCDWGIPLKQVIMLRGQLLKVCMNGVCEIWSEFCRIAGKKRVERALLGSTDMMETINAAIEAHKFQLWKQGKTWTGEDKLRRKDPGAQIRWAKRMLQCSREQYQARSAGCDAETARLRMLDGMSRSLRGWLGIGPRGEVAQDAQSWRMDTQQRVQRSTDEFLTLLRRETADGANLEEDLLDEDDFVNAKSYDGEEPEEDRRGGEGGRGKGAGEDEEDTGSPDDGGSPDGGGILEGGASGGQRSTGGRTSGAPLVGAPCTGRAEHAGDVQGNAALAAGVQGPTAEGGCESDIKHWRLAVGLGSSGAESGEDDVRCESGTAGPGRLARLAGSNDAGAGWLVGQLHAGCDEGGTEARGRTPAEKGQLGGSQDGYEAKGEGASCRRHVQGCAVAPGPARRPRRRRARAGPGGLRKVEGSGLVGGSNKLSADTGSDAAWTSGAAGCGPSSNGGSGSVNKEVYGPHVCGLGKWSGGSSREDGIHPAGGGIGGEQSEPELNMDTAGSLQCELAMVEAGDCEDGRDHTGANRVLLGGTTVHHFQQGRRWKQEARKRLQLQGPYNRKQASGAPGGHCARGSGKEGRHAGGRIWQYPLRRR
jgi:hypothetical protein